jgi:hypothetical protein
MPEQQVSREEQTRDRGELDRRLRQAAIPSPFGDTDEREQRETEERPVDRAGRG